MDNQRLTAEQCKDFDAKYGDDWFELPTPAGAMAFRKPSQPDYERFTDKMIKSGNESITARELSHVCLLHPDQAAAKAIFERYPHAPTIIARGLQRLAGQELKIVTKGL